MHLSASRSSSGTRVASPCISWSSGAASHRWKTVPRRQQSSLLRSRQKGKRLSSISQMMTPREKMSLGEEQCAGQLQISGAEQGCVKPGLCLCLRSGWQDSPKSITLIRNFFCMRMLAGFRSRCTTRYSCRNFKEQATRYSRQILVCSTIVSFRCYSRSYRLGRSLYSIRRALSSTPPCSATLQYFSSRLALPLRICYRMAFSWATLLRPPRPSSRFTATLLWVGMAGPGVSCCPVCMLSEPTNQQSMSTTLIELKPPALTFLRSDSPSLLASRMQLKMVLLSTVLVGVLKESEALSLRQLRSRSLRGKETSRSVRKQKRETSRLPLRKFLKSFRSWANPYFSRCSCWLKRCSWRAFSCSRASGTEERSAKRSRAAILWSMGRLGASSGALGGGGGWLVSSSRLCMGWKRQLSWRAKLATTVCTKRRIWRQERGRGWARRVVRRSSPVRGFRAGFRYRNTGSKYSWLLKILQASLRRSAVSTRRWRLPGVSSCRLTSTLRRPTPVRTRPSALTDRQISRRCSQTAAVPGVVSPGVVKGHKPSRFRRRASRMEEGGSGRGGGEGGGWFWGGWGVSQPFGNLSYYQIIKLIVEIN